MYEVEIQGIKNIPSLIFPIPQNGVHIVTGKNGTGKTTLFTCLSRIRNRVAFRKGFPSSENDVYDAFTGSITYRAGNNQVTYTRRKNGEWRPDKSNNVLEQFGFGEVINVSTNAKRIFLQEVINPRKRRACDDRLNLLLQEVLDDDKFKNMFMITTGDLRGGRGATVEDRRKNTAYAIELTKEKYYTERNFSFGEIVLLNLFFDILNAPERSLILIDEVELALHPSAQIRLIGALKRIAKEKRQTIIISTHSSSIIRSEKDVILLEKELDKINVLLHCPPAKAIGAIGVREETMPDIVVLVEDRMANTLFKALMKKYLKLEEKNSYLDVRILEIGGFSNVINFYREARNYIFYNNIYIAAFMDKDVETDIIPYGHFGNYEIIYAWQNDKKRLRFLPFTPEILLMKVFTDSKSDLLRELKQTYANQQIDYAIEEILAFCQYEQPFPEFADQSAYNAFIKARGSFRSKCKIMSADIVEDIVEQTNASFDEVLRFVYEFAVRTSDQLINVREILGPVFNRS